MIRRYRRRRPLRREAETEQRPRRRRRGFSRSAVREGEEPVRRPRRRRLEARQEEPVRRRPSRSRRARGLRRERDAYTPMRAELTQEMDSLEDAAKDLLEAISATRRLLPSRGRLGPQRLDMIAANQVGDTLAFDSDEINVVKCTIQNNSTGVYAKAGEVLMRNNIIKNNRHIEEGGKIINNANARCENNTGYEEVKK